MPLDAGDAPLNRTSNELVGKRIVICEDEGITQMQLRRTLTRAGLIVVGTAINGRDGVEVTLREHPDIVLMDIRMPVMDGLEATRRILETASYCIVLLTAYSDAEYQQQAASYGVSGYVVKPITSDLLLPMLQDAYRAFRARQEQPN
jgi:YesN/AraC family two-component response regulator